VEEGNDEVEKKDETSEATEKENSDVEKKWKKRTRRKRTTDSNTVEGRRGKEEENAVSKRWTMRKTGCKRWTRRKRMTRRNEKSRSKNVHRKFWSNKGALLLKGR
jgi:hypothetical protein